MKVEAKKFKNVLIANRGEISIRIALTLREMGIRAVAAFTDPDRGALHARSADESIEIGSYPFNRDGRLGATLVARGTDRAELTKVIDEIVADFAALGGETRLP